jgi:hypothetical protein
MAESTLSLALTDLQGDVGYFLGYGRGLGTVTDPTWNSQQQQNVTVCVNSGLRQFYFPPPLPGEMGSYDWSFTKPITTLTLPSGAQYIQLPDDFGGIDGQITVQGVTTSLTPWPINIVGEGTLRQYYANIPTASGRPTMAAVVPLKGTSVSSGQRFQLNFWPQADQNYTINFPYYIHPDALTTGTPFPLGGLIHAETIRESCLMAAENFLDDTSQIHAQKFMERLTASVNNDRRLKPQLVGLNRDRSDLAALDYNRQILHYFNYGGITVEGVQY